MGGHEPLLSEAFCSRSRREWANLLSLSISWLKINTNQDFTYGTGVTGSVRLRDACAYYLNKHFVGLDKQPTLQVKPDHIIMGTGLISILPVIARIVCNPRVGILIAAPYYSGFDSNFKFSGACPIPVKVPYDKIGTADEVEYLETAMAPGINAVVLCNPHNPLGRAYQKKAIEAYCRFAEKHNLHLICDEIYAQSVFGEDAQQFTSVLSLDLVDLEVNPARVHVLYSMSKDFSASGFRIGLCVSRDNPSIIQSMAAQATFMRVSSPADILWSALLLSDQENRAPEDFKNITEYLRDNKCILKSAYDEVIESLQHLGIHYIEASAGLFMMVDFRPIIEDKTGKVGPIVGFDDKTPMSDRERLLNLYLQEKYKVCLSPGLPYHMQECGWFRLVFSIRDKVRQEGLKRLSNALKPLL